MVNNEHRMGSNQNVNRGWRKYFTDISDLDTVGVNWLKMYHVVCFVLWRWAVNLRVSGVTEADSPITQSHPAVSKCTIHCVYYDSTEWNGSDSKNTKNLAWNSQADATLEKLRVTEKWKGERRKRLSHLLGCSFDVFVWERWLLFEWSVTLSREKHSDTRLLSCLHWDCAEITARAKMDDTALMSTPTAAAWPPQAGQQPGSQGTEVYTFSPSNLQPAECCVVVSLQWGIALSAPSSLSDLADRGLANLEVCYILQHAVGYFAMDIPSWVFTVDWVM